MGQKVNGWGQVKSLIIGDNSILFEDLCFVETPPAMGGCLGAWMNNWVDV